MMEVQKTYPGGALRRGERSRMKDWYVFSLTRMLLYLIFHGRLHGKKEKSPNKILAYGRPMQRTG